MKKILVFVSLIMVVLLSSCTYKNVTNHSTVKYTNPELYTVGNYEGVNEIDSLSVHFLNGNVTIKESADEKIRITETYNQEETPDNVLRVHYYFDNSTLKIEPSDAGVIYFKELKKELVIELPSDVILNQLKIDTVSSVCNVKVEAKEVDFDTVSGNCNMTNNALERLDVDTVSGVFTVKTNTFNMINFDSVSGNLNLYVANTMKVRVDFDTVSGTVTNELEDTSVTVNVDADTVSGCVFVFANDNTVE